MISPVAGGWRFHPTLWPTLFAILGVLVLVALGVWQLQRLQWKEGLIADREARAAAPVTAVPAKITDPAALQYHRVRLTGRFLHDREMYLTGRSYRGMAGYHVVTPFHMDDGRTVLIDRGWVPVGRKDPMRRQSGQVGGRVSLEGIIKVGGWKQQSFLEPESRSGKDTWIYVDPPAMAKRLGLVDPVTEIYIEAAPGDTAGKLPVAPEVHVELPNNHLQYAITWFCLAFALSVIYVLYHMRRDETT